MISNKNKSKFISLFLTLCIILSLAPIAVQAEDTITPNWDFYNLQCYSSDHSQSTGRGNWYNTANRENFSEFSLSVCNFNGDNLRALKLSVTSEDNAKSGALMLTKLVNSSLLNEAHGMRFHVSNPSNSVVSLGITYCDTNAVYSCHKNGVYYLETKDSVYQVRPTKLWDSFCDGGASDVGIIEVPSGFTGYIYLPFSSTTRANQKATFSRVRLFVGANAGSTQTLYLESIDYYSTAVDFSNAFTTDYGFDAFSTIPANNATSGYVSLGFSHENYDGLSGKALKADYKKIEGKAYTQLRLNGLWGKVYNSTAYGMRFWVKNPQKDNVTVKLQFGDSYKGCRVNSAYYLKNIDGETIRYTTTKATDENIGCITLPANFEGYVYLPYLLASSVTTSHLILSPKIADEITLYYDSFSSFDKQELNDVVWYENNIKVNVGPTLLPSVSYTKTMLDSAEGQMLSVKNNNSFSIPLLIDNNAGYCYLKHEDGDIEYVNFSNNVFDIPRDFMGKVYIPFTQTQTALYSISVKNTSMSGSFDIEKIGIYNYEIYPIGDVNGDCKFDIIDLVRYKKYLVGQTTDISENSDINADKRYNSVDIVLLRKGLLVDIISAKNSYVAPEIIEPLDISVYSSLYNDSPLIIAEENICDYGADTSGNTDSTVAFKTAILKAEQKGGGTVYVPEGRYLISDTITIPESVTICGQWQSPEISSVGENGSIILAKGDNFLSSAVFELGTSTGLIGLTVIYPEQNILSPIKYDFAVRMVGTRCYTLENFTVVGAYNGIELGATTACQLYYLKNVYISALNIGISNDKTNDIGRMETVKCSPEYWCDNVVAPFSEAEKENIKAYTRTNAYGMQFFLNDWSVFYNIHISYMKTGMYFGVTNTETDRGFNGKFYNVSIENCDTGIYIDKTKTGAADFTNITIKTDVPATAGIDTGDAYYGTCMFYNTTIQGEFAYPVRNNGIAQSGNPGTLEFMSGTIGGYSGASYGVTVNSGSVTLQDIYFSNSSKHVKTSDTITSFVALGCSYNGTRDFDFPFLWQVRKDWKVDDTAVESYNAQNLDLGTEEYKPSANNVVCVTDYGADTLLADNTEAFTKALNAVKNVGGTVYVPAGNWRFEGELTIPTGVELRGSNATQHIQNTECRSGTILWCFNESGLDGTEFITLQENSGVKGFSVFYEEQIGNTVEYPYTIKANGKNCHVTNITLTNSYNGIDFASCDTSGYYISGVNGCPINFGIHVGGASTGGILQNCHFNPNFSFILSRTVASVSDRLYNASAYKIGDVINATAYGIFAYGYKNGLHFVSDGTGGADNSILVNCSVDGSETAVRLETAKSVEITNGQFVAMTSENDKHCLIADENFDGTFKLYNSNLWGPTNYILKICGGNGELHLVNLCTGYGEYSLYMTGGNTLFNAVCFHNKSITVSGSETVAEFFGCFTRNYQVVIEPEIQNNAKVTVKNSHWA